MQEPSQPSGEALAGRNDVFILREIPGMDPDVLEAIGSKAKALIIETNPHGAIPTDLHPTIKQLVDQGVCVFVLPEISKSGQGVTQWWDQPQVDAYKAGATFLSRASTVDSLAVAQAIKTAVASGLTGADLASVIQDQFGYAPAENTTPPSPVQDWRNHAEKLAQEGLGTMKIDADGNYVGWEENEPSD